MSIRRDQPITALGEVPIESEDVADPFCVHQREARAIDQAQATTVRSEQRIQRGQVQLFMNPNNTEQRDNPFPQVSDGFEPETVLKQRRRIYEHAHFR